MTVSVRPLSPSAYMVLLVVSVLLELGNATIPLVLVVGSVTMLPTILIASTAVPRAIAFWVCSFGERAEVSVLRRLRKTRQVSDARSV
jgi:hypothetical protein